MEEEEEVVVVMDMQDSSLKSNGCASSNVKKIDLMQISMRRCSQGQTMQHATTCIRKVRPIKSHPNLTQPNLQCAAARSGDGSIG